MIAFAQLSCRRMRIFHRLNPHLLLALLAFLAAIAIGALRPALAQATYPTVRSAWSFRLRPAASRIRPRASSRTNSPKSSSQRFYVENQPGAGGITAARTALGAAADGYTLIMLTNGTAVSVSLFEKLPFDPVKDFTPVSSLGFFDFAFVTSASSGFKTLAEFIAAAKAKPGSSMSAPSMSARHRTSPPNCSRHQPISTSRSCRFAATTRPRSRYCRAIFRS